MGTKNKIMLKYVKKFHKNVFINCPFDKNYRSLLRPLLFTIIYLDYTPRIASENSDSGEARINKIYKLVEQSRYSIHDLSRIQSLKKQEIYRFNMPFELGVDIGCRLFEGSTWKSKKCLILETKQYRYQKALSDLSNSDIKSHKNDPETLVRQVRNWFVETLHIKAKSSTTIWEKFNEFMADFYVKRKREKFGPKDLQYMPEPELIRFMKEWIMKKK